MSNEITIKQVVSDYTMYKKYFDDCITEKDMDVLITIDVDNSYVLGKYREEHPNTEFIMIERTRNELICGVVGGTTYYIDDNNNDYFTEKTHKNEKTQFERDLNKIKTMIKGKRVQILGNPPFDKGGEIWDKCRELTHNIAWIMPLNQYKTNDRYLYIDTHIKIDSKLFNGTKIGDNNLLITSFKENPSKSITYEDYVFKFSDDSFKPFYKWNRENFKDISVIQINSKNYNLFNRDTDFLTSNRGCNNENYFATNGGMDYQYNLTSDEVHLNSGLSLIKFKNKLSKQNFCTWAYNNNLKERFINKLMKGLHLISSGNLCNMAIPQIDWETISAHPLWKEGDYDSAVLDVMGLKWNEDKTGVVTK